MANEFRNVRRRGIPLGGPMGEVERNEWEEGKVAFPERMPPETSILPQRGKDVEIERLAAAVARRLQKGVAQAPLEVEDQPATTQVWNMWNDVGWDVAAAAPIVQRVDSGVKGRVYFWCFSVGLPAGIIWLAPGQGVQAAFGLLPGSGIPLNAPSVAGLFDGAAWSAAIGDDIGYYASAGAAGARLVVVEGVRA